MYTIIKALLHHQFILLLVSSTDRKEILTANEPEELLKPQQSIGKWTINIIAHKELTNESFSPLEFLQW